MEIILFLIKSNLELIQSINKFQCKLHFVKTSTEQNFTHEPSDL